MLSDNDFSLNSGLSIVGHLMSLGKGFELMADSSRRRRFSTIPLTLILSLREKKLAPPTLTVSPEEKKPPHLFIRWLWLTAGVW